ncbi:MAG TPA: serine hydrolase [Anaerolineaceae bacterium]|nr:serine hydrolase [Anaerolineaceae bacterium]
MNTQKSNSRIIFISKPAHIRFTHLVLVLAVLVLVQTSACGALQAIGPASPWPTSTPESQGMDSGQLLNMINSIETQALNIHSILILRHGHVVLELYYPPFGPLDKHMLFSVTKSVTSALIGIAIQEGKIKSIDQKVLDFFPDRQIANMDDLKKAITLRDLLNMTSGFTAADQDMWASANWVQFTLDSPMDATPGTSFDYNSGNTMLLSAILQKVTGETALAYAKEHLFGPLGINDFYWAADPTGVTEGPLGLMLTTREMASFGYLYLQGGKWNGQQVVPAEWVRASGQSQVPSDWVCSPPGSCPENGYGYLWWQTKDGSIAEGYGGEDIYVVPSKDLVVVYTSGVPYDQQDAVIELTEQYILPAIKSDQALPASPSSKELFDRLAEIIQPKAQPTPVLPTIASTINGKTLLLDDNQVGWEQVSLTFKGNQAWMTCKIKGNPQELKFAIGLDGTYRLTPVSRIEQQTTEQIPGRNALNPFQYGFLLGVPVDESVAMKGKWTTDGSFNVTVQGTSDFDQENITFIFSSGGGKIVWFSFNDGSILDVDGKFQ